MNDPLSIAEAEQALRFISPDMKREHWFRIAAALKDEYGEGGFDAFQSWSETGGNYNARACKDTWRSAKPGHVHIGTIIKLATDGGWQRAKRELSAEDKQRLAAERKKERAERQAREQADAEKRAQLQDTVAALCRQVWDTATTDKLAEHPYLIRKQVNGAGCRLATEAVVILVSEAAGTADLCKSSKAPSMAAAKAAGLSVFRIVKGDLLMPLSNSAGELRTIQRIGVDGSKFVPKGCQLKGTALLLGEPVADKPLGYTEGYATGASVHAITGWPVLVCVSTGHLAAAAEAYQALPCSQRVWLADNDKNGAGQDAAQTCQQKFGGIIALPQFPQPQQQEPADVAADPA